MRKVPIPAFIFTFMIIFSFFLTYCIEKSDAPEIQEISMDIVIGDYTGLTLDTDAIHFGTIDKEKKDPRTRLLQISNEDNKTKNVRLTAHGQLSSFVLFSEENFILGPYENKTIEITISPSSDMDYGNYTGTVRAIIREREE